VRLERSPKAPEQVTHVLAGIVEFSERMAKGFVRIGRRFVRSASCWEGRGLRVEGPGRVSGVRRQVSPAGDMCPVSGGRGQAAAVEGQLLTVSGFTDCERLLTAAWHILCAIPQSRHPAVEDLGGAPLTLLGARAQPRGSG
jgi:hypothetical protein